MEFLLFYCFILLYFIFSFFKKNLADKKTLNNYINKLEGDLIEEKENQNKILKDFEKKQNEINIINNDLNRLKEIYENKISLLNNKINTDEDSISELKAEIKNKNEVKIFLLFYFILEFERA
jgi:peptidoglycan hydrolase CwlO-like protein